MPSTTSYNFGDIVLVAFHRKRPDVILMAVTSQVRRAPGFGEVLIQEWRGAGLIKPSVILPVVFNAEKHIVLKRLGRLDEEDQQVLGKIMRAVIG
jgi:mRNA interferase MazF